MKTLVGQLHAGCYLLLFSVLFSGQIQSQNYATMDDPRDNQSYRTVQIGGQVWMAENLNYAVEGSRFYLDDTVFCDKLGRLYRYELALTVCPEGWHLPSDEEWKTMEIAMGMKPKEADKNDYRGIRKNMVLELVEGGSSGFDIKFGGAYKNFYDYFGTKSGLDYVAIDSKAFFWTSTIFKGRTNMAWARFLKVHDNAINRSAFFTLSAYSVRCVKD